MTILDIKLFSIYIDRDGIYFDNGVFVSTAQFSSCKERLVVVMQVFQIFREHQNKILF